MFKVIKNAIKRHRIKKQLIKDIDMKLYGDDFDDFTYKIVVKRKRIIN